MLKISSFILLFFPLLPYSYGQSEFIHGKWFVVQKSAQSDLEVPSRIRFTRDSIRFNSMEMKDSMQCSEIFVFYEDATLVNSGKCLPIDAAQYGFKYYGMNGAWKFLDKNTLLIDYYFGLSVYHCTFRFRFKTGGFELKLIHTEVQEMKEM